MDVTAAYRKRLHEALRTDPERFAYLLRERWRGDDGPPLNNDRSWCSRLLYVYETTPEELRPVWSQTLCDLFDGFTTRRLSRLSLEDRLELLGGLELALGMNWPRAEAARLDAFLAGTLRYALSEEFPPPRDLIEEDDFFGQPESDVVAALLRLAARRLAWEQIAEEHWEYALNRTDDFGDVAVAWRLWEIARWAITADAKDWIAKRIDVLDERLEATDTVPGNLTRLFFLTEYDKGPEAVAELILLTLRSIDPPGRNRRLELAEKLDYFGTSHEKIRGELWRRKGDHAEPIPPEEIPKRIEQIRRAWREKGRAAIEVWWEDRLIA